MGGLGAAAGADLDMDTPPDLGSDAELPDEDAADPGPLLATPGANLDGPTSDMDSAPAPADTPAKRDIDEYGRSYSVNKGKRYYHKNRDDRNGKRLAIHGLAGIGKKDLHPGKRDMDELTKISYSFSENLKSSYYDEQEEKLLNENNEIKKLIQSLEMETSKK